MAKIALNGGAYTARSVIANAQRCINLYPEKNPEDAAAEYTHYPTPGLVTLTAAPNAAPVRGLYTATNGRLYAVVGRRVFYVDADWGLHQVGQLDIDAATPVRMKDNAETLVIVDGTHVGYMLDLASQTFRVIDSEAFYGAATVDYLDSFLLFNRPGTRQFYCTLSNNTVFDPLYYAQKTSAPDNLAALLVKKRELWLIGERTTEVWYNAGGAAFPFASMPGTFIEHGTCAPYSVAKDGATVIWLTRNERGQAVVMRAVGYDPQKVSTYALEAEWDGYATVSDATAYMYLSGGHVFYVLTFPTADKTWVYDCVENLWHQRAWMDAGGDLHRHRSNCHAFAYGQHVVGDFQNGRLYRLDDNVYLDSGASILRLRSFPHMGSEAKRVVYNQFIADMEVGTAGLLLADPKVQLRWSDTRGQSWGEPVQQTVGRTGAYLTTVQWRRLGLARDRVFELSWSQPYRTALNGAYVDVAVCGT